ncbi:hypothetical protein CSC45_5414 [Pseudomonas aeruginosa]|nr:hypothetical protein CSC45_5414 [Pseudomonas aeruginosa]
MGHFSHGIHLTMSNNQRFRNGLSDVLQGRRRAFGLPLVPGAPGRRRGERPALQLHGTDPTGRDGGWLELSAAAQEVGHQNESNDVDQSIQAHRVLLVCISWV